MMAAAIQSTTRQNGGHHRVSATYRRRCCQKSFSPWPASPATRSHADPARAATAIRMKLAAAALRYRGPLVRECASSTFFSRLASSPSSGSKTVERPIPIIKISCP